MNLSLVRVARSASLLFTAIALAACAKSPTAAEEGSRPDENLSETTSQPILGGTVASSFPEAVLVDMTQDGELAAACSGTLIAPKLVLTAGHCVAGFDGWTITAPFAQGAQANGTRAMTYDWKDDGSEQVDPNEHDLGLIILDRAIDIGSYPTIASAPLSNGSKVFNVGRIRNGRLSTSALYQGPNITVQSGKSEGFPFDYAASEIIESGDSGGGVFQAGTHALVAVNSGASGVGDGEVLARVDLERTWIQQQISTYGGSGSGTGSGGSHGGGSGSGSGSGAGTGSGSGSGTGSGSGSGSGTGTGHGHSRGHGQPTMPTCATTDDGTNEDHMHAATLHGDVCGSLQDGDQDWYTFDVDPGSSYEVKLDAGGDAELVVWKTTFGGYAQLSGTPTADYSAFTGSGGHYLVAVYSPSGEAQMYGLSINNQ
jgi:hypothetical protein